MQPNDKKDSHGEERRVLRARKRTKLRLVTRSVERIGLTQTRIVPTNMNRETERLPHKWVVWVGFG